MEIDPRYAQVAIERWQTFTGARATRVGRLGEPETPASAQIEQLTTAEARA
jgi:hypothetical protein